MFRLFAAAVIALSQSSALRPEQAKDHVGQQVVVEGVVAQVSHSTKSNTTFLNFCNPYPNYCFEAVIFQSAQAQFPDASNWQAKKVRVSGVVKMYQGKPEVVLDKKQQVEVVK